MAMQTCQKCGRTKDVKKFYKYRDGKYAELCKDCLTMHIDAFDPDTFTWILKKFDLPYIPQEWNILRDKDFEKKGARISGGAVFGKYIAKMRLNQWKKYTWDDNEKIQAELESAQRHEAADYAANFSQEQLEFMRQQRDNGEISQAEYETIVPVQFRQDEIEQKVENEAKVLMNADSPKELGTGSVRHASTAGIDPITLAGSGEVIENIGMTNEGTYSVDFGAELTQDDIKYLAMKWGQFYKPSEWIELERIYDEMTRSFEIHDADSKNTLILICKTTLKANQAIDMGDIDGYTKLTRTLDIQRKSAKFTAAQNKEQKTTQFNSIGEIVAFCEKEGGRIPPHQIEVIDKVDEIIQDLKEYTRDLIYQDTTLAQQIEAYLQQLKNKEQMKKDMAEARTEGLNYVPVEDDDIAEFEEAMQEMKQQDDDNAHWKGMITE